MRPDFLRQMIGERPEVRPGAALLASLVNRLADGKASKHMRAYMEGARGEAGEKTSKTGEPDVRPLCCGEALRRLFGKCMLGTEMETLCEHLLPLQLTVGVKSGVEVMAHLARQWGQKCKNDRSRVLL